MIYPLTLFVASFPRSGNTWLRLLLADILLQKAGYQTATKLPIHQDEIIPDLHARGDSREGIIPNPAIPYQSLLLKTHFPWEPDMGKSICVVRNPIDSLVSFYHFHLRYDHLKEKAQNGADYFVRENSYLWKRHTQSFLNAYQGLPGEIHLLTYENLTQNPVFSLTAACRFLKIECEQGMIIKAIQNHEFGKQQEVEKKASPNSNSLFFRKGQIGSGKAEITENTCLSLESDLNPLFETVRKHEDTMLAKFIK